MPAFGEISGLQRPGHRHRRLCQTASRQRGEDHPHFHQPSAGGSVRQRQYAPGHAPCQADNHQPHHPPPMRSARSLADASHYTLADGDQATYPAHRMRPVRRIANDDIKYPCYTPARRS